MEGFAEMISCRESADRGSDCYLQDLEKPYFNKKSLQTSLESLEFTSLFFLILKFYLLFLAELGLCCFEQAFSSCGKPVFVVVRGLLIAVAPLVLGFKTQLW